MATARRARRRARATRQTADGLYRQGSRRGERNKWFPVSRRGVPAIAGFYQNQDGSVTVTLYGANTAPANDRDGTSLGSVTITDANGAIAQIHHRERECIPLRLDHVSSALSAAAVSRSPAGRSANSTKAASVGSPAVGVQQWRRLAQHRQSRHRDVQVPARIPSTIKHDRRSQRRHSSQIRAGYPLRHR